MMLKCPHCSAKLKDEGALQDHILAKHVVSEDNCALVTTISEDARLEFGVSVYGLYDTQASADAGGDPDRADVFPECLQELWARPDQEGNLLHETWWQGHNHGQSRWLPETRAAKRLLPGCT